MKCLFNYKHFSSHYHIKYLISFPNCNKISVLLDRLTAWKNLFILSGILDFDMNSYIIILQSQSTAFKSCIQVFWRNNLPCRLVTFLPLSPHTWQILRRRMTYFGSWFENLQALIVGKACSEPVVIGSYGWECSDLIPGSRKPGLSQLYPVNPGPYLC